MINLVQLKTDKNLVDSIDWEMTPEKAIEMYLEWGTGWIRGNDFVSSMGKESLYFVVYDWNGPEVTLIRRSTAGAEEIATVEVPKELFDKAIKDDGYAPGVGVHSLNQPLKEWVSDAVGGSFW